MTQNLRLKVERFVYPRVAMHPMVGLPIDPAKYPRTNRWMSAIADRPSFKRSERVRPD